MPAAPQFDRLCVVLVAARNPLNIGAAARAMSNFGFGRLRVVSPYAAAFREARSAVGASQVLAAAQEYASVAEAVSDCALVVGTTAVGRRELRHPLRLPEEGARIIGKELARKRREAGRVALLFGSEKFGLSNEDFSHCQWLLHIPTTEQNFSMNLGQAVAVCLYEVAREARAPQQAAKRARAATAGSGALATAGEMERISTLLLEAMVASGYLKLRPTRDAAARLRRLVRRLKLPAGDVAAWLSILRQIVWKLQRPDDRG